MVKAPLRLLNYIYWQVFEGNLRYSTFIVNLARPPPWLLTFVQRHYFQAPYKKMTMISSYYLSTNTVKMIYAFSIRLVSSQESFPPPNSRVISCLSNLDSFDFVEYLLCVRHWGYDNETKRQSIYILKKFMPQEDTQIITLINTKNYNQW